LDFSDRDRKRALDAVDLFREEDTSYFLFVPWLFRLLVFSFSGGRARRGQLLEFVEAPGMLNGQSHAQGRVQN
jgi:hypothetical protein